MSRDGPYDLTTVSHIKNCDNQPRWAEYSVQYCLLYAVYVLYVSYVQYRTFWELNPRLVVSLSSMHHTAEARGDPCRSAMAWNRKREHGRWLNVRCLEDLCHCPILNPGCFFFFGPRRKRANLYQIGHIACTAHCTAAVDLLIMTYCIVNID